MLLFKSKSAGVKSGKKVLPVLKAGTLGGKGFYSLPAPERRVKYEKLCKRIGKKTVLGKIIAIRVLNKRINPELSKKAITDYNWVVKNC